MQLKYAKKTLKNVYDIIKFVISLCKVHQAKLCNHNDTFHFNILYKMFLIPTNNLESYSHVAKDVAFPWSPTGVVDFDNFRCCEAVFRESCSLPPSGLCASSSR